MKPFIPVLGTENQSPFQLESRKEIIAVMRGLKDKKQLVSMIINDGAEVMISMILDVNDDDNSVTVGCASSNTANQRIVEAPRVSFEAALDKIGIQFSSQSVQRTTFQQTPALKFTMPVSVIRLQRREFYRINTPITHPILCTIPLDKKHGGGYIKLPAADISCGGVALLDEKKLLDATFGSIYKQAKIELPGIGIVDVTLQIRNSIDLTLMNEKTSRRIGFQFLDLPQNLLSQIQKFITKLERERNARRTNLG